MKRIVLIIEYDGTNYVGWQIQPNGIAVQQVIGNALKKITGENLTLHASGRTDSGVHARAQAAHFDTESRIPAEKFAFALNTYLPPDIRIKASLEMPREGEAEFHARFSVQKKHYRYRVLNSRHASAFLRSTALHIHTPLSIEKLNAAAELFLGTHDFAAFKATGSKAETAARSAAAAAEVEAARLKTALDTANERAAEKKKIYADAKALTDAAEADYDSKRSDFDAADVVVRNADKNVSAAKNAHDNAVEKLRNAENRLETARAKLEDAIKNSEFADSEAVRLRNSVHVIETRYETARIHYMESGKGEPLILVHSAGQSLYTFRRLFYKLAMYYRVIAVDLVGHGYSDRPDFFDYTIGDHAESLARFMDSMGIESAHILGFSFGAGYALELAHKHPERVGKIVAICPGGVTSEMPLTVRMMESGLFGGIASRMYNLKSVKKMLNECVFDHTVINEHDAAEYFKPVADSSSRYAVRRTLAEFDENALISSLREIQAPVLLLWGEDDKWHPAGEVDEYRSSLRSCSCTVIRNAGHLVHEEKPDRIAELVRGFIPAGYDN